VRFQARETLTLFPRASFRRSVMPRRLLLVPLLIGLIAADKPEDAVKKEQTKLQGTWEPVSAENNGQPAPADELGDYRFVVKGSDVMWTFDKGKKHFKGAVKMLDPTTTPKIIDIAFEDGPLKGSVEGIYELDGDNLKLCIHPQPDAKKRP